MGKKIRTRGPPPPTSKMLCTPTTINYIQNLPGVCNTLHTFLYASDNLVMEVVPCTAETPARHFQLGLQYGSSTMMVQLETGVENKPC